MKTSIKTKSQITFTFSPEDYFLVKSDKDNVIMGKYHLAHRIDRSYKGKDEDIGMPVIFLSEEEAELCRQAGFTEVH